MKAIRKSDGKVIEVKEWRGASDVIYSELDMNAFYQASDLDFSVDEAEEAENTVISGWVARDSDGRLNLYDDCPLRDFIDTYKYWEGGSSFELPEDLFPDLTWSSEPMEVEITIKPKKK